MLLSTSLLPDARVTSNTQIAVVIDVLRATSVMSSALNAGAEQVITCKEVEAAKRFASERSPRPLLCGERECKPISGFDLGNSPAEYQPPVVAGRTLVMTTTNGTSAIDAATEAAEVITASFLNLSAVVQKLSVAKNIHLVCAGTNGQITAEDTLLAGAIIAQLNEAETVEYEDDDSLLALALWEAWFPASPAVGNPSPKRLSTKLRETRGGPQSTESWLRERSRPLLGGRYDHARSNASLQIPADVSVASNAILPAKALSRARGI